MLLPHFVLKVSNFSHVTVPEPDLGGLVIQTIQTIQTLIWGWGVSPLQISTFRPQFDLKMRGAGQAPGPLTWIGHCVIILSFLSEGM